jgi:hypothetical protein
VLFFIRSFTVYVILVYCFNVSLQSQGTVNIIRLYGPPQTRGQSQSHPQSQINAIVSTQNPYLLCVVFFFFFFFTVFVILCFCYFNVSLHFQGTANIVGLYGHPQPHLSSQPVGSSHSQWSSSKPVTRGRNIVPTVEKVIEVIESNKKKRKKSEWQKY